MAREPRESVRYGIGEWYGHSLASLDKAQLNQFGAIAAARFGNVPCPFRQAANPGAECRKKGGVCTLKKHRLDAGGVVTLEGPLVTVCPSRFWDKNQIFREIGTLVLGTSNPTLVKEVQFLAAVDSEDGDAVGRIDTILVDPADEKRWCALEIQAVYFSGPSMTSHLGQYENAEFAPLFPDGIRRPDFRSSGPKRLMPQLQVKVPTLRRWGKKMVVVVDKPFADSLGKFTEVPHLSNCDIIWLVIDYDPDTGNIVTERTVFTTLESSVEALTAGTPLSLDAFEAEVSGFLNSNSPRALAKVVRLPEEI